MTKTNHETVTLKLPRAMADALAWAMMVGAPGRPHNLLPYRYGADGAKRPAVKDWAQWHGGSGLRAQPLAVWDDWSRYAQKTNITAWATLPGALGVVVADVDAPHLLARVLDTYGETEVVVCTPRGGYHLYYRAPPSPPITRTGVIGAGSYDIKSVGGTAHAPGTHRPGGGAYTAEAPGIVDGVLRIARGPALPAGALYDLMPMFPVDRLEAEWSLYHAGTDDLPLDGEPRYVTTLEEIDSIRRYMAAAGPAISHNAGHDHTFKLLRKIGDLGASEETALALAVEWDDDNQPPWGEADIRKKVRDAYRTRKAPIGWRIGELEVHNVGPSPDDDEATEAELVDMLHAITTNQSKEDEAK